MALSGLSILRSGGSWENVCGCRELRCLVIQDLRGECLQEQNAGSMVVFYGL